MKPSLPKGTRDFGPQQMAKRNFIFTTIQSVFQKFGFQPLETPSMENLSVLTGKYGDEGDKLIFRILDSGDFFGSVKDQILEEVERTTHIKDFLEFSLKYLMEKAYNDLEEDKLRNKAILSGFILKNFESTLKHGDKSSVYLDDYTEKRLKDFVENDKDFLADTFVKHFQQILSSPKEKLNFDSHFDQYVSTEINDIIIIKVFENFLSPLLTDFESYLPTSKELSSEISQKALRYDLTVPFARYVVMNQHEITFPFKRYQIQPVWRADRPQKGRYREFYQCDADVVGTGSLLCEAEIVMMISEVFEKLGITDYTININNRKVLMGIAEAIGAQGKENDLFVAIDKLDKIGKEKVLAELKERGIPEEAVEKLNPIFNVSGGNEAVVGAAKEIVKGSETGEKGIAEVSGILQLFTAFSAENTWQYQEKVQFDITLARGLSYYTGTIFEVKVNNVNIGSVSGGGRYDNLTGMFGLPGVSGVGISFGVDRLYDVMEELQLFSAEQLSGTQILLINFDEAPARHALGLLAQLRAAGIRAEMYPDPVKLKKQFGYADKNNIPYVLMAGPEEITTATYAFKNMQTGEQQALSITEIIEKLKNSSSV